MISEVAAITVKPGSEADFEAAVAQAVPLFRAACGCRHLRLERTIEEPAHYRLLVEWDTLADHIDHFRSSPAFAKWRDLVSAYLARPPAVTHGKVVLDAF